VEKREIGETGENEGRRGNWEIGKLSFKKYKIIN